MNDDDKLPLSRTESQGAAQKKFGFGLYSFLSGQYIRGQNSENEGVAAKLEKC